MLDLKFARMANEPARERRVKEYKDKLIELFGCFLIGIVICLFLLVIYYI